MKRFLLVLVPVFAVRAGAQVQRGASPPPAPPAKSQGPAAPGGRILLPSGKPVSPPRGATTPGRGPVQIQTGFVGSLRPPPARAPASGRSLSGRGPFHREPIRARRVSVEQTRLRRAGFFAPTLVNLIPRWTVAFGARPDAEPRAVAAEPRDEATWFKRVVGWSPGGDASAGRGSRPQTRIGELLAALDADTLRLEWVDRAEVRAVQFLTLTADEGVLTTHYLEQPPFAIELGLSPRLTEIEALATYGDGTRRILRVSLSRLRTQLGL